MDWISGVLYAKRRYSTWFDKSFQVNRDMVNRDELSEISWINDNSSFREVVAKKEKTQMFLQLEVGDHSQNVLWCEPF